MTPREELLQIDKYIAGLKGLLGGSTMLASYIASSLPEIEAWLRITSLFVGITVGVVTILSICRKK
jgi:hypothetical protein